MASSFIRLDDSPMFQRQIFSLEQSSSELKDKCEKLCDGSKKFMMAIEEALEGENAFADSLELFGGSNDDPLSVSIGGPVISKFITTLRELASFKELLRSQVEHVLIDRLSQFVNVDLQEAKSSRRHFDKAIQAYDQAREKFVSLKKNTREDVVAELEEDLHNSKSTFEKSRFSLVNSLVNIETKKKFEFLESISAIMDAHLRYFKLGYDLLSQMEPFIHQVLTYTQQSKELANIEQDKLAKRIQEYRTQVELHSQQVLSNPESTESNNGNRIVGLNSYKSIEAVMQSVSSGEVQTIKQGYLLKRSNTRGNWKRRFFILDNQGNLFYYRTKGPKTMALLGSEFGYIEIALYEVDDKDSYSYPSEQSSGMFGRFRAKHNRASSFYDESLEFHAVDLCTSTIKMDAEDTDLRLCLRIISPLKNYTLQAESEADRMDWVNKITGAIASILNAQFLQQPRHGTSYHVRNNSATGTSLSSQTLDSGEGSVHDQDQVQSVRETLREIPGNDMCAECNTPEPDWASLNLGILLCVECSGVHRNLGVHVSKVRSLTFDVKVWEPTVLDLFHNLGNAHCNSIWEGVLLLDDDRSDESTDKITSITKPCPTDAFQLKEKYIQAKYIEKSLIVRQDAIAEGSSPSASIWEAVKANNLRDVYQIIVTSTKTPIHTKFEDVVSHDLNHHVSANELPDDCGSTEEDLPRDPSTCQTMKDSNDPGGCLQGCSLLHLACHCGSETMLELLLQFGADINMCDFHGRTPLHHCIASEKNSLAKFLVRRGACPTIKDGGGLNALERAMELGAITDEELFLLLAECQ